jgi:hypothetical protein
VVYPAGSRARRPVLRKRGVRRWSLIRASVDVGVDVDVGLDVNIYVEVGDPALTTFYATS